MPYIKQEERDHLDKDLKQLAETASKCSVGQLNYILTAICHTYIRTGGGRKYSNFNDVIGVLECCKQEIYRVQAAKYEDQKIAENGDVNWIDEK
jgi:hypothetical protein